MKSQKLNLEGLKVQSFITDIKNKSALNLGGNSRDCSSSIETEDWGEGCPPIK